MIQKFPRRWDDITKVNYLQRKIILNAIAYYELDRSTLSDKDYDELSKQLVEMHKAVNIEDTQYGYIMYDFDGTTGFDLYSRLNEKDKKYLMNIALHALGVKSNKKEEKKLEVKKGRLF